MTFHQKWLIRAGRKLRPSNTPASGSHGTMTRQILSPTEPMWQRFVPRQSRQGAPTHFLKSFTVLIGCGSAWCDFFLPSGSDTCTGDRRADPHLSVATFESEPRFTSPPVLSSSFQIGPYTALSNGGHPVGYWPSG